MPNTQVRYLQAGVNNVEYKLYVSLPISYKDSINKKYPVIYLLDADYSFAIVKNIVDHLTQRNHLQEIIVVGIAYGGSDQYRMNRTRDYTPIHSNEDVSFKEIQSNYSGGGPAFAKFLKDELIPHINNIFRTNNDNVLCGHSYGGLFATWVLLTDPTLFNGYIIVSPSLWYSKGFIFNVKEQLTNNYHHKKRVYFSAGDLENPVMPEEVKRINKYLNSLNVKFLTLTYDIGLKETHNSIFPYAVSNGIRYVFKGK